MRRLRPVRQVRGVWRAPAGFAPQSTNPRAPWYEPPEWRQVRPWLAQLSPLPEGAKRSSGARRRLAGRNARLARAGAMGAYEALAAATLAEASGQCVSVSHLLADGPGPMRLEDREPAAAPLVSKPTTNSGRIPDQLPGDLLAGLGVHQARVEASEPARVAEADARRAAYELEAQRLPGLRVAEADALHHAKASGPWADDGAAEVDEEAWEAFRDAREARRRQELRCHRLLRAAQRLEGCGGLVDTAVAHCPSDGAALVDPSDGSTVLRGHRCEQAGCPLCDPARAAARAEELERRIAVWQRREARRARAEERGANKPKHIVLTARDIPGQSLEDALAVRRRAFQLLRASPEWGRYVEGWRVRWEWTETPATTTDDGLTIPGHYHVHAHLAVVGNYWPKLGRWRTPDESDPTVAGRELVPPLRWEQDGDALVPTLDWRAARAWEPGLVAAWTEAMRKASGADWPADELNVDIHALWDVDAVKEVTKYVCKSWEMGADSRTESVRVMLGKRLYESGGALRGREPATVRQPEQLMAPVCPCCGRVYPGTRGVWWLATDKAVDRWERASRNGPRAHGPPLVVRYSDA